MNSTTQEKTAMETIMEKISDLNQHVTLNNDLVILAKSIFFYAP